MAGSEEEARLKARTFRALNLARQVIFLFIQCPRHGADLAFKIKKHDS